MRGLIVHTPHRARGPRGRGKPLVAPPSGPLGGPQAVAPKMPPRAPQDRSKRPQDVPKTAPQTPQDGPLRVQRRLKGRPRRPRWPARQPRLPQEAPRWRKDVSKMALDAPKTVYDSLRMAQDGQRRPRGASKTDVVHFWTVCCYTSLIKATRLAAALGCVGGGTRCVKNKS